MKIRRILLALVTLLGLFTVYAFPVYAATSLYGYPQMTGDFVSSGRVLMRGLNNTRGTTYSGIEVIVTGVTNGAIDSAAAIAGDATVFTDELESALDTGGADMNLLPTVPVVNDTYVFGSLVPFNALRIDIGTQGVGNWTVTWEYPTSASAWAALGNVTDATTSFKAAPGNHEVSWADWPSDWYKRTFAYSGGTTASMYLVRARVSEFANVTTPPEGDQAWALCDNTIAGIIGIVGVARSYSDAVGYVGNGKRGQFVMSTNGLATATPTGLYCQVQGTVDWDGSSATIRRVAGRCYGYDRYGNNSYWFSTTVNAPYEVYAPN